MEDYFLRDKSKMFVIGDVKIACTKLGTAIRFEVPFSGMAFYQPRLSDEKSDVIFQVSEVESSDIKEMLWGSNEFMIPTFVYRLENDQFEWKTFTHEEESLLSFRISSDLSHVILYEDNTNTKGERAFHEFGSIFSYLLLNHHAAVFHGIVMEYNGKGILVMASSGTGKTTHTRMWRDLENALIINGDRGLVRKIDDVWYAYGSPWAGSSGEYINRRVPITCIVSLERDSYNHVEELNLFDSTLYLMQRVFAPAWPGKLQDKGFDICEEIAKEIPVIRMYCTPEVESVKILKDYILENFNG